MDAPQGNNDTPVVKPFCPPMRNLVTMATRLVFLLLLSLLLPTEAWAAAASHPAGTRPIPPSPQRSGDPDVGKRYLLYGDYVNAGVPVGVFRATHALLAGNQLKRTGINRRVPYNFTAVKAPNGATVVGPNCMHCHAGRINGQFILGLGNTHLDFSLDQSAFFPLVDSAMKALHGANSPEWRAYQPFRRAMRVTGPALVTAARGVNPADKIAAVLALHRDPDTLEWHETPKRPVPREVIPTDVPPWWHMKKKHAMLYNGMGRGDFGRIMMASSLLTLHDRRKAEEVDPQFGHVLAFLKSIEPPKWPFALDATLARRGEKIFNQNCAQCHGTYGKKETYPNLLVSLKKVRTDPLLSNAARDPRYNYFFKWFNKGWFGRGKHPAKLVPEGGYVAPPLDGIWATAPYLHNGSVPTLADLLDSTRRPDRWRRTFISRDYDPAKVGWRYTVEPRRRGGATYDTTLPGYSNEGHPFADALTDANRSALLEYLKTL
jgi:mono/diheme cytochrome c family protein